MGKITEYPCGLMAYAENPSMLLERMSGMAREVVSSPYAPMIEEHERQYAEEFKKRYEKEISGMPDESDYGGRICYLLAVMKRMVEPMFHSADESVRMAWFYDFEDFYFNYLQWAWDGYENAHMDVHRGYVSRNETDMGMLELERRLLRCMDMVASSFPDESPLCSRAVINGLWELSDVEWSLRECFCHRDATEPRDGH